jgi:predicted site-specific integrase-resolvase
MTLPPEAQALTIAEAAAALQVSERTIKRYRATGVLPASKRLGVARIPVSAISALLAGEEAQPKRHAGRR